MRLSGCDKVASMSVVMHDAEAEQQMLEAAAEQREGEVEELIEEAENVEKASKSSKRKTARAAATTKK